MSDSLQPHGLQPIRLLCSWDFLGKNTGAGCHFLLQRIFPTQGSNPCLLDFLHWQGNSLPLSHLGSPKVGKGAPRFEPGTSLNIYNLSIIPQKVEGGGSVKKAVSVSNVFNEGFHLDEDFNAFYFDKNNKNY